MEIMSNQQPNILVVDDRVENLRAIQQTLRDLPATIHCCESGEAALNLLVRHPFALAILDVQMPEMDGFELAELMSSHASTEQIPIIFVTAISKENTYVKKGYHVGAVDYLFKPFDPELLSSKVKIFLKLYQQTLNAIQLQKRQRFILEHITDGWWEWEKDSDTLFCSEKFRKKLGLEENVPVRKLSEWKSLIYQDDLSIFDQMLLKFSSASPANQSIVRFQHTQGHLLWMLCKGVFLKSEKSEEIGKIIGTYLDITKLKKIEEKLKRSNQDLEQFAYIASHDLRAPLRGVQSLIEWIEEENPNNFNTATKEYFLKLKTRISRMDNLINGILDYSRTERKKPVVTPLNLNILVSTVIDMLSPPRNCHITISSDLPIILGDEIQIRQIFSNLISNAIKYNDKKEIFIEINFKENLHEYEINIIDNGPGIDEKFHEKVFQLFQTLQPRDTVESTGVGLAIVKKIITSHGGRVWITSTLGAGTTFHFTWPKRFNLSIEQKEKKNYG